MAQITVRDLRVDYPTSDGSLRAIDNLSLSIQSGEAVCLIGPSGCGKSTLLQALCGLIAPSAGSIQIDGQEINGPRLNTALILQDFGLLPWKTVYQNAELGLLIRRVSPEERRERTMTALHEVDLETFAKAYPSELSGGMKQRLALARSLALDVDFFCMDEPLSALDALLREQLQDTILSLWQKRKHTQLLVTHSIDEAVYLGQRILVCSSRPGRIVAEIENPLMGTAGFRENPVFLEQCNRIREALNASQSKGATAAQPEAGDAR